MTTDTATIQPDETEPDDRPIVWLVSFPRSGNTFVRNILKEVYGIASTEYHVDKNLQKTTIEGFRVVKTHLPIHELTPLSDIDKVVLIVRDGRDCMVSIAHHRKDIVEPGSTFKQNMHAAIVAEKGSYFGGWSSNVDSWLNRADLVIRYEDLVKNPLEQTERLRQIMDLPEANKSALPSFDKLKTGGDAVAYGKGELRTGNKEARTPAFTTKFFRRGIAGAWKDEMNDEDHLLFWNIHADTMRRLGYTRDGKIIEPGEYMEYDLRNKLGILTAKPRTLKVLVEASKLNDKGNDGVKRYIHELISQYARMNLDKNYWEIDLYIHGKVVPLKKLYPTKPRIRYRKKLEPNTVTDDASKISESAIYVKNNAESKHVSLEDRLGEEDSLESIALHEKIQGRKQRIKKKITRIFPWIDKNPITIFIRKTLHYCILAILYMRNYLLIAKDKGRHFSIVFLQFLKDQVLMLFINFIIWLIQKTAELIIHFSIILKNRFTEKTEHVRNQSTTQLYRLGKGIKAFVQRINFGSNNIFNQYDIIHASLPQHAIEFQYAKTPLVTTIHDFTHLTHRHFHTAENVYNAQIGFESIETRKNAHLISISDHTTSDIMQFMTLKKHKLKKVSEAANGNMFHLHINYDELRAVQQKYGVEASRYIITLSTIEPRKNIISAVRAFIQYLNQSKDGITKMVIAGKMGWGESKYKELETEIDKMPDRFIFTGFVDDEDLPLLLNGARAMCYVSLYEGFGLPILEAYKCGVPVICGNNSSQIEVAGPAGLLVDPLDVDEISTLLNRLINDDDFYRHKRNASLRHAERFTWYDTANETLNFYREILNI